MVLNILEKDIREAARAFTWNYDGLEFVINQVDS